MMSCWMHAQDTYNRVLWSFEVYQDQKDMFAYCLKDLPFDVAGFVKRLHDWNHRAYEERYRKVVNIPPYSPVSRTPKMSHMELFKMLQSIDYQCVDSDAYRQSEDHKLVRSILESMAFYLVSEMAEYRAASWG